MPDIILGDDVKDIYVAKLAQGILLGLRSRLLFPKIGFADYSDEVKEQGESVLVGVAGKFTGVHQSPDVEVPLQKSGISKRSIVLNKYLPCDFLVKDVAQAISGTNLVQTFSQSAVDAIATSVDGTFADLFDSTYYAGAGTITATATSAAIVGVGTDFTRIGAGCLLKTAGGQIRTVLSVTDATHLTLTAVITDTEAAVAYSLSNIVNYANGTAFGDGAMLAAEKMLTLHNVPDNSRVLVANVDDYSDLLSETKYIGASSINAAMLRQGALGEIRGFSTYRNNNKIKSYSLGMSPDCVGFAFRPLKVPDDVAYITSKVVTDPETGIGMRFTLSYDAANRGIRTSIDVLYGASLFFGERTVKIIEAAA